MPGWLWVVLGILLGCVVFTALMCWVSWKVAHDPDR